MPETRIKFHFQHGSAESGRLDLYDAGVSLEGIARTTAIITHAYLNGGIRTRGDAAHGAKFYIRAPKQGSFLYEVVIWTGTAIAAGVFYDFTKYAIRETVGYFTSPDDEYAALQKRIEPTIGELPAALEAPLDAVHRPIRREPAIELDVTRPRGEKLAHLDKDSAAHLQLRTVTPPHPIVGNVTRYNTLTGWGRFYDRTEERAVSFFLKESIPQDQRSLITWSLHEANTGQPGTLYIKGDAIVTPTDRIKRYAVKEISDVPF